MSTTKLSNILGGGNKPKKFLTLPEIPVSTPTKTTQVTSKSYVDSIATQTLSQANTDAQNIVNTAINNMVSYTMRVNGTNLYIEQK